MNALSPQPTEPVEKKDRFVSVRFAPELASRLADYVHVKKKTTKTSIDAEVQRAVRAQLDVEESATGYSVDAFARIVASNDALAKSIKTYIKEWVSKHPSEDHDLKKATIQDQEHPRGKTAGGNRR